MASSIQVIRSADLYKDSRNTRASFETYKTQRGAILVDGVSVVESLPVNDAYRFNREYASVLYSPVIGYFSLFSGADGIERQMNSYLSGQSSAQFFEQINALLGDADAPDRWHYRSLQLLTTGDATNSGTVTGLQLAHHPVCADPQVQHSSTDQIEVPRQGGRVKGQRAGIIDTLVARQFRVRLEREPFAGGGACVERGLERDGMGRSMRDGMAFR